MARSLRQVINAARDGKRITAAEKKLLGDQLDIWWRIRCERCRRTFPTDQLDAGGGRCDECNETVASGACQ